jgi:hypothetical protein
MYPRNFPLYPWFAAAIASASVDGVVIDAGPAELTGGAVLSDVPRNTAGAGALVGTASCV